MIRKLFTTITAISCLTLVAGSPASAAEPLMSDYSCVPTFLSNTAPPNIMIILDNSGSMNFNAYGTYQCDNCWTAGEEYAGQPNCNTFDGQVISGSDDAEEDAPGTYADQNFLDLGAENGATDVIVGVRFQGVGVPQGIGFVPSGVTITNAYIEFTAASSLAGALSLEILGQAADSPITYEGTLAAKSDDNISARSVTDASVIWDATSPALEGQMVDWIANTTYRTPDISAIIQEIIDRPGWSRESAMAFTFKYAVNGNYREAYSFDNNPANAPTLHIEFTPSICKQYYGYFNPEWLYVWDNNKFIHQYKKLDYDEAATCWNVEDTAGAAVGCKDNNAFATELLWDGNFMNWATMRRIDVARKVLMGGLATSRTGGGNQTVFGETPDQTGRVFWKQYNSAGRAAVTPYLGAYYFRLGEGNVDIFDTGFNELDSFALAIKKELAFEPDDFHEGNVAGVLQKVGDVARWGNIFFNDGNGSNESGGRVASTIGTNITSLITDLQNTGADTWTPLAEAYYVAMQYFMQEDVAGGLDYPNNVIPNANDGDDPYCLDPPCPNPEDYLHCADSFVILFTDGASTMDSMIPAVYKDYDGDGDGTACDEDTGAGCDYGSGGTDFLDDLALYARTVDLRPDLECPQNLLLYPIYAFGNDDNARNLLRDAAKNGGFDDTNGNSEPDLDEEWDKNLDGVPDTYFEATDGGNLQQALINAIMDILNRASSGTAVSVLATSEEGEGNVVQAFFNPLITATTPGSTDTAEWVGFLQSFWVDSRGFLREDTIKDGKLDIEEDKVILFEISEAQTCSNEKVSINVFDVSAAEPYPDLENDTPTVLEGMAELSPVWEAGSVLADTAADDRKIFTTLGDAEVTPQTLTEFTLANASDIKPFLGVMDAATWGYLGAGHDDRASNLVHYMRGNDDGFIGTTLMRNRTVDGKTLKLGDIVNSSPVTVAAPPDQFGFIYTDESYDEYDQLYTVRKVGTDIFGRETVIYVGANDGMLHAFTSWVYDEEDKEFKQPGTAGVFQSNPASPIDEQMGTELWAYIPQAMLPHLKWLASKAYSHVYYVDARPKIVDARIFPDDATHPNGWGTVLLGGMRFGGGAIEVTDDFAPIDGVLETKTFTSSYFALDITNPRDPKLLWDRTYDDLGFTTYFPSVVKVGHLDYRATAGGFRKADDKWYAVLGSGTSFDQRCEGNSTEPAHIYVVDLATGEPFKNQVSGKDWLFETPDDNAFLGSSASFDKEMNYNVDAIYMTESHDTNGGAQLGAVYKVTVPWKCTAADCTDIPYGATKIGTDWVGEYVVDPLDATNPWTLSKLFDSPRPITAPPSLSIDFDDAVWVYFGTGRYYNLTDKSTNDPEYLYGLKDPFFNREHGADAATTVFGDDYYHNYDQFLTLDNSVGSKIMDAGDLIVMEYGAVYDTNNVSQGDFDDLIRLQGEHNGWFRELYSDADVSERALSKPVIFGGLTLFTTFIPSVEICGFGGESFLYALYFETGTPFPRAAFVPGTEDYIIGGDTHKRVMEKFSLGIGLASSAALHSGSEEEGGMTGYVQQSTGQVQGISLNPALDPQSRLKNWQDMTVESILEEE